MRKKIYTILVITSVICVTLFIACDNTDNNLGNQHLPTYTKAKALKQDFKIGYRTVSADMSAGNSGNNINGVSYNKIYVSSSYGYVGSIPNQEYGQVTCEYLTQLRCPEGFKFKLNPIDNKIDSAFITIYYNGYSGDPIAPLEISAYQLNNPLEFDKYSISDISKYTDKSILLGKTTFYAKNGTLVDDNNRIHAIQIPLDDKTFGQKIYDLTLSNSEHFANQTNFDKFFPGIYITTTAGVGSVVRVFATALTFYFQVEEEVKDKESPTGTKIIEVTKTQELVHTSEVPQLARFANEDLDKLIERTETLKEYSYIKAPAGVLTEITLPTEEIRAFMNAAPKGYERILNSVQLSIEGTSQFTHDNSGKENTYALPAPENILLLPKDSVPTYFSNELTDINRPFTSFLGEKPIASSLTYNFGNITSVVLKHIKDENNNGRDLTLWMIPVDRTEGQSPSGASTTSSISNLVLPSAMKILLDEKNTTIKVYVIERKIGAPF